MNGHHLPAQVEVSEGVGDSGADLAAVVVIVVSEPLQMNSESVW